MHKIRILMSIFPTWFKIVNADGKKLVFFRRDVTKAFLQSNPSKRMTYDCTPVQFSSFYPKRKYKIWLSMTQLYGDVEAGLYWNRTFIFWLGENNLGTTQSIHEPVPLFISPAATDFLLCSDDTGTMVTEEDLLLEHKITVRGKCQDYQLPPIDFKGIDIIQMEAPSRSHKNRMQKRWQCPIWKTNSQRKLVLSDRLMMMKSRFFLVAGKLAMFTTGTIPLKSFHASVLLQGNNKPKTVQALIETRSVLTFIRSQQLSYILYWTVDTNTVHKNLYTDGAFQNLSTNHSQLGFVITMYDGCHTFNLIYWHCSRASWRACFTEKGEVYLWAQESNVFEIWKKHFSSTQEEYVYSLLRS